MTFAAKLFAAIMTFYLLISDFLYASQCLWLSKEIDNYLVFGVGQAELIGPMRKAFVDAGYDHEWIIKTMWQIKKQGVRIVDVYDPQLESLLRDRGYDDRSFEYIESFRDQMIALMVQDNDTMNNIIILINSKNIEEIKLRGADIPVGFVQAFVHESTHARMAFIRRRFRNDSTKFFYHAGRSPWQIVEEIVAYTFQERRFTNRRLMLLRSLRKDKAYAKHFERGLDDFLTAMYLMERKYKTPYLAVPIHKFLRFVSQLKNEEVVKFRSETDKLGWENFYQRSKSQIEGDSVP